MVAVENLSKAYKIYSKPIDRLTEIFLGKERHRKFWALREVSFEVFEGETFGIIGDNGAGKSTLLKILAGTLSPTSGKVNVNGKVAALLELGMGFHPELTGRENIYLNASLLGFSKKEIEEKESEIIEFAEIGDFIDQPIKTYSSGMKVRLAFSIAVQVDPDVLIIDEALSVGDQHFQKKSLDKILEFKNEGKTILFCSHSMYHITHLCQRALWLHKGEVKQIGYAKEVVKAYEDYCMERNASNEEEVTFFIGKLDFSLLKNGEVCHEFETGDNLEVEIYYDMPQKFHIAMFIKRRDGIDLFATSTQLDGFSPLEGKGSVRLVLPDLPLLSGVYELGIVLIDDTGNIKFNAKSAFFSVKKTREELGMFLFKHLWEV